MANSKINFLKRFIIFQFAFLFIFSKVQNLKKSYKDFYKRIKFIAKLSKISQQKLELIENNSNNIFILIFSLYFLSSLFALLFNSGLGKHISGMFTIIMAIIYCNPVTTIKKNFESHKYSRDDWKNYVPSLEFCLIAAVGIIMTLTSFQIDNNEVEEGDNAPKKKV